MIGADRDGRIVRVSYRVLDDRAEGLAARLRGLGLGPNRAVAVFSNRTVEMIVGMLAVLKTGAAYTPLDPNYPNERIAWTLKDGAIAYALTQRALAERITAMGVTPIFLDEPDPSETARAAGRPPIVSHQLSHIIYTSGSTGKPKGVLVRHDAVTTLLDWAESFFSPEDRSSVLASTSICFDLSVFEIFGPLTWGGAVVLADNALALPFHAARHEVRLLNTVPSAMDALLQSNGLPDAVRVVNLAGEPLSQQLAAALYSRAHIEKVVNLYGPSEDTTYSTFSHVPRGATPTIGKPVAGTRAHLLDATGNLAAPGSEGELYLAGSGLAAGYHARPDLTAERFLPNPFEHDQPGARMYRTGDLCRLDPDNDLIFLGRTDHQVKIRGFRIELGEIEAALSRHPEVRQVLVMAREDRPGDKQLTAYLVLEPSAQQRAPIAWRSFLAQRLPEFMAPAHFVVLARFPLTPNGKIDRNALPAPGQDRALLSSAYEPPETDTERHLTALWSAVLGVDEIGRNDDFLELGGNSLQGTRILARVQTMFATRISLDALFRFRTPAQLGKHLLHSEKSEPDAAIEVCAEPGPRPLAFAQERLWFLDRLNPGSAFYNLPLAYALSGRVDLRLLEHCFSAITARHEALRTRFSLGPDGEPVQIAEPELAFEPVLIDLTGDQEMRSLLTRLMDQEIHRPFHLETGPPLRIFICRVAADEHLLLLNMHHIVSDGWSLALLQKELTETYAALIEDRAPRPSRLPIQYGDFAVWQRRSTSQALFEEQLTYWRERLADAPTVLELPWDRPRPPIQTYRGDRLIFHVSEEVTAATARLGREYRVTEYMRLLGAYAVLLSRYARQNDVVIGSPIANRTRAELEPMIGFFVNTLAIRIRFSARSDSFADLLETVRETTLTAFARQDVPFEQVVESVSPDRDPSRSPLFQTVFALEDYETRPELALPGFVLREQNQAGHIAKFDLSLLARVQDGRIRATFEYNSDLFDRATIARMSSHYQNLLHQLAATPNRPISRIPMLGLDERESLLTSWNNRAPGYPREATLHGVLQTHAQNFGEVQALASRTEEITYDALNRKANRLAHLLIERGVVAEDRVGLSLDQSTDRIIALLAILKAGGAYTPLDPNYPRDRLALMIEDAGIQCLITQTGPLDDRRDLDLVILDKDLDLSFYPETNPARDVHPDQLSHVMYTSGSTGRPKGVQLSHRNVMQFAFGLTPIRLEAGDNVAQVSNISFDAFTCEVWPTLLRGCRLCLIDRNSLLDADALTEALAYFRIDVLILTTALFNQFAHDRPELFQTLKFSLFGGERAEPDAIRAVLAENPSLTVLNGYGPTECSVLATVMTVVRLSPEAVHVPIGLPIGETKAYPLDETLEPAPIGVAGEFFLGGDGLARGYLNRPDITADRFIPNPFATPRHPGSRLYRTGDLVRRLAAHGKDETGELGPFEFQARQDHQVKIRGFRIEPGEIEAVLRQHPEIKDAVVRAQDYPSGKQLVAYLIGKLDGPSCREYLSDRLPAYMVPAHFTVLRAFPLTPNRKIDLSALPKPELGETGETYTAPRNPIEASLSEIWSDLLGAERVGVHGDFF